MAQEFRDNEGSDWQDEMSGGVPMAIVLLAIGAWSALVGGFLVWLVMA